MMTLADLQTQWRDLPPDEVLAASPAWLDRHPSDSITPAALTALTNDSTSSGPDFTADLL